MTEERTNEVARIDRELDIPFCERCGRQVERFQFDYETYDAVNHGTGMIERRHTGVVVATIECHGETWKATGRFK